MTSASSSELCIDSADNASKMTATVQDVTEGSAENEKHFYEVTASKRHPSCSSPDGVDCCAVSLLAEPLLKPEQSGLSPPACATPLKRKLATPKERPTEGHNYKFVNPNGFKTQLVVVIPKELKHKSFDSRSFDLAQQAPELRPFLEDLVNGQRKGLEQVGCLAAHALLMKPHSAIPVQASFMAPLNAVHIFYRLETNDIFRCKSSWRMPAAMDDWVRFQRNGPTSGTLFPCDGAAGVKGVLKRTGAKQKAPAKHSAALPFSVALYDLVELLQQGRSISHHPCLKQPKRAAHICDSSPSVFHRDDVPMTVSFTAAPTGAPHPKLKAASQLETQPASPKSSCQQMAPTNMVSTAGSLSVNGFLDLPRGVRMAVSGTLRIDGALTLDGDGDTIELKCCRLDLRPCERLVQS